METIAKAWFEDNRIFIETSGGKVLSRPLEAFPLLLEANNRKRQDFKIGKFGDDIRWESIDEDIHISSFFENKEPMPVNPVAEAFRKFPQINVSEFAKQIGINKSLMAKYIYGIKTPGPERKKQIQDGLHKIAEELLMIEL